MHVPCSNSLFDLLYLICLVSQLSRTQGSSLGYWTKKMWKAHRMLTMARMCDSQRENLCGHSHMTAQQYRVLGHHLDGGLLMTLTEQ